MAEPDVFTLRVDEEIIEDKDLFLVDRTVVTGWTWIDQKVSVEAELLHDVFPVVWVVPVDPGIGEVDLVAEGPILFYWVLCQSRHTVEAIVDADAVPVHRCGYKRLVGEVNEDS